MFIEFLIVFTVGLVVGVGLNIVICCLPERIKISGNLLRILKEKCQQRKVTMLLRYILVELITGMVFVLLYYRFSISVAFMLFAYLLSILIAVFFIDFYYKIIPDELVIAALPGGIAAFIYNLFAPFGVYGDRAWWNPLAGILPGAGFLLLVAIIGMLIYKNEDVLGMGDVKLFVPIGIFLGWRMCILALLLSLLAGGLTSLFLIAAGIRKRKDTIPFGPFIVSATFITVMWGRDIMVLYLK
ncbi:MAG TPA: prepilin peptidase [Clostridiaceae bacterium]|nr:prepilin peptidase [Clostridiaceae bacterium]